MSFLHLFQPTSPWGVSLTTLSMTSLTKDGWTGAGCC